MRTSLATAVALAALATGLPSYASEQWHPCQRAGLREIWANHAGRILRSPGGATYACVYAAGRVVPLDGERDAAAFPFDLTNRYIAAQKNTDGVEFSGSYIDVLTARGAFAYAAKLDDDYPASDVALSPTGGLAWIGCGRFRPDGTLTPHGTYYCVVTRLDHRGRKVIDRGQSKVRTPRTLHWSRSAKVVTWHLDGRAHRATLGSAPTGARLY